MQRITSRQNAIVKRFRAAARGTDPRVMLLDGEHLLDEAIRSGVGVDVAAFADHLDGAQLQRAAARAGADVVAVNAHVLAAISPVRQPSGVVAIARRRELTLDDVFAATPALVIVLSDVQDPGNVGAAIRAAEACGATGVVCSEATADPFGWKALRGAMGSAFRLPVLAKQPIANTIAKARACSVRVLATIARGGTPLPACDFRASTAVLFGSEGAGLSPDVIDRADDRLTIPMEAPVESLNVAVSAALVVYEAARQRRTTG